MNLILTMGGGSQEVSFNRVRTVSKTNIASKSNFVGSKVSNMDSQYLKSGFIYLSTLQSGIAKRGTGGRPEKRDNDDVVSIIMGGGIEAESLDTKSKVVGLFNFQDITKSGKVIAKAAAEGLSNSPQPLYSISVYKKEIWYDRQDGAEHEQEIWTPVVLGATAATIRDFNVGNNRYYKYVFRLVKNTASGSVEYPEGIIVPIKTNWTGWSITELHETDDPMVFTASPKDVWKFKYNISTGAQTQNVSKTQQETLSQYPIFSHGVKNSVSGSVTCLLGREIINADYTNTEFVYGQDNNTTETSFIWKEEVGSTENLGGYRERLGRLTNSCEKNASYLSAELLGFRNLSSNEAVDMLDKWREVCYSGSPKLLRDEKGQTFIIQITDPTNTTNESWDRRPEEISFNWVEIASAKDCRIIQTD